MSRIFLQLLIIASLFVSNTNTISAQQQGTLFGNEVQMFIISDVPNDRPTPLLAQCQSGDTYIGRHALKIGELLAWHFRINFIKTTLFYCNFYWGSKTQSFDVFTVGSEDECKPSTTRDYSCYWLVKTDGFYRSNNKTMWKKTHDWA